MTAASTQQILVTGDFVLDFHIYQGQRFHYGDQSSQGVVVQPQMGGAGLVYDLLQQLQKLHKGDDCEPFHSHSSHTISDIIINTPLSPSQHAFAFLRPFSSGKKDYWRVSEAMGFGANAADENQTHEDNVDNQECDGNQQPETFDVVTISEGGMGFRQSEDWEDLPFDEARWIVLKSAEPLMSGPLWERLSLKYHDKLILVVSASDLRKTNACISKGLSWDTTLRHLFNELIDGELQALKQCQHLIVSFGSEGALWVDLSKPKSVASLIYDPGVVEGDHAISMQGTVFGLLSCLTASVSAQACNEAPDFEQACEAGLAAMKNLLLEGHGPATELARGFPAKRLAEIIAIPDFNYSRARLIFPEKKLDDNWSFLMESCKSDETKSDSLTTHEMARLVAQRGPIALDNLPRLKVGNLLSVDRHETESLRILSGLIQDYQHRNSGKKPLSLGVFGPPGSGKSFAVGQIAKSLCGKEGWLEFNLSQFDSPADLIGAFHQIRDRVLRGILPVAFFDEFDSQKLRWLQYLLAPMQDGHFQEGQITHPIGKCILIFAGGTSWTFESFGPPEQADDENHAVFRHAKGPDFKSRLDGFLNVIGPNQKKKLKPEGNGYVPDGIDEHDICYPIRRALMIRAELGYFGNDKLDIDDGILHALLHAREFTHGSRSLSKIIQPFKQPDRGRLYKSMLPPMSIIAMHTDAEIFLQHCESIASSVANIMMPSGRETTCLSSYFSPEEIEVLAPAIHETYNAMYGGEKRFHELSQFLQNSNRAASRRMVHNLRLINLVITNGSNDESERYWIQRKIEYYLELLAEAEHDGWMKWHLEQGWRYAPGKKDEAKQTHPDLRPYNELTQHDQDKDRNTIRHYIDFVNKAEKKIEFG